MASISLGLLVPRLGGCYHFVDTDTVHPHLLYIVIIVIYNCLLDFVPDMTFPQTTKQNNRNHVYYSLVKLESM